MTSHLDAPASRLRSRTAFAMVDPEWLRLPISPTEFKVLIALSLHADWSSTGHGRCFPNRETIAKETMSDPTRVSEALPKLTSLGLIHVARLGRKNVYFVRQPGLTHPMPPSNAEPFFAWLAAHGHRFDVDQHGHLKQIEGDIGSIAPLYRAIVNEYERGLTEARLRESVKPLTKAA